VRCFGGPLRVNRDCIIALSRVIKWEDDNGALFDRTLTPEQVMDRLEERVGPEGRKLFEQFIRKVNILQAKQQLEAQAQMGVTERSGDRNS
jgi:hypothetical protein